MLLQELEDLKNLLALNHLEVMVMTDWGSQNPQHKKLIQEDLLKKNLNPQQFSISHTQNLGGYAYTLDKNVVIGFDVEVTDRVTAPIARRVCNLKEEYLAAPSTASLWCAKEASFKALRGPNQPMIIAEVRVLDWEIKSSHIETFQIETSSTSLKPLDTGCIVHKKFYTFGFFKFNA